MKAISLWEPWATAIAIGAKAIETRGWPTSYRGALAIHAAKTREMAEYFLLKPSVRAAFAAAGITTVDQLPFGCVVATCRLVGCVRTELMRDNLPPLELELGGYEDRRFAWKLEEVVRLPVPIPARGSQGFWGWDGGPSQLS